MPIDKIYEIGCEECGEVFHSFGTKKEAGEDYVRLGGIIKGKKYYCDNDCYTKALKRKSKTGDKK